MNDNPFNVTLIEDHYRVTLGNQICSINYFNTKEEAEEYIKTKPWELIFNLCGTITTSIIKNQKTKKSNERENKNNSQTRQKQLEH